MTPFELQQSDNNFFSAGRNAFRIGIDILSNPYSGKARRLWRNGFEREQRNSYKITWVYFSKDMEEDFEAEERYERKMRKQRKGQ